MRTRKNTKRSKNSRSFKKRNKKTYKKSRSGGTLKINKFYDIFNVRNNYVIKKNPETGEWERYQKPTFLGQLWNKFNKN